MKGEIWHNLNNVHVAQGNTLSQNMTGITSSCAIPVTNVGLKSLGVFGLISLSSMNAMNL